MTSPAFTIEEYTDHLQTIYNFTYWAGKIHLFFTKRDPSSRLANDAATVQREGLYSLEFIMRHLSESDFPETFNPGIDHDSARSPLLPGVPEEQAAAFNENLKITGFLDQSDISLDSLSCISAFYLHLHKFISRLIAKFEDYQNKMFLVAMPMYASSVISQAFIEVQTEYIKQDIQSSSQVMP